MKNKYVVEDNCGTFKGEPELFNIYNYERMPEEYKTDVQKVKYEQTQKIHANLQLTKEDLQDKLKNMQVDKEDSLDPELEGHATVANIKTVGCKIDKKEYVVLNMQNTGMGLAILKSLMINHEFKVKGLKIPKFSIRKNCIISREDFENHIVPLIKNKTPVLDWYKALSKYHRKNKEKDFIKQGYIDKKKIYQAAQKLGNCGLAVAKKMHLAKFIEEYGEIGGRIKYYEDELRMHSYVDVEKYMSIYNTNNMTDEKKKEKMIDLFTQTLTNKNIPLSKPKTMKARVNKMFKLIKKIDMLRGKLNEEKINTIVKNIEDMLSDKQQIV